MDSISSEEDGKTQQLREQFNQQRARMKELYLQKEGEVMFFSHPYFHKLTLN